MSSEKEDDFREDKCPQESRVSSVGWMFSGKAGVLGEVGVVRDDRYPQ